MENAIAIGAPLWCVAQRRRDFTWRQSGTVWHLRTWYRNERGRATHLRGPAACGFNPLDGWWIQFYSGAPPPEPRRICLACVRIGFDGRQGA